MPTNKKMIKMNQSGTPVQQDRATIIISAHYQEWSPSNMTTVRFAYDRLLAPENVPFQASQKLQPGKRVAINLGDLEPGHCEIVLGHNPIDIPKGSEAGEMLREAQLANTIRIFNDTGWQVGEIRPGRACFMHFGGPLFAECSTTTAFLHVTAFPA